MGRADATGRKWRHTRPECAGATDRGVGGFVNPLVSGIFAVVRSYFIQDTQQNRTFRKIARHSQMSDSRIGED